MNEYIVLNGTYNETTDSQFEYFKCLYCGYTTSEFCCARESAREEIDRHIYLAHKGKQ